MTSDKSPTVANDAVEKKIGAIEKEVATVKVVIRRASRTRLALLAGALAIVGITIFMFYRLAMDFKSEENLTKLANAATERAQQTTQPLVVENVRQLVDTSMPVLQEAFAQQAEKDQAKYQEVLDRERQILYENMNAELRKKLTTHYEQTAQKYQAILREEFPELEDPELLDQMTASIIEIMERLAEEYYTEKMESQLEGLNAKWMELDMAEVPATGETSLEQQFVASLFYLAAMKIDKESVE